MEVVISTAYLRNPLVDVGDHAGRELRIVGDIKVVIVNVQLGGGIGGACGAESDTDEVLAQDTAENGVAKAAVLSEDLVHDVPLDDLALVPGDLGRNVVLDDLRQGVTVGNLLHPLRQLAVPQQGVAANQLAVALGPVDDLVSVAEVELASRGYDVLAFPPKEPPRQGHSRSIASHFMLFSQVTWPNWALAMFITPVLLRW